MKSVTVSPDLSLQLTVVGIKIEYDEESTIKNIIDRAKVELKVPFPDSSVYTLYPKNYDTPLDETELMSKQPYVRNKLT